MIHPRLSNLALSLLALFLLVGTASLSAQTPIGGSISDGAGGPLVSGTVYHVTSNLLVPGGSTLTIEPGAVVKFGLGLRLDVDGTLICGGAGSQVFFTALTDDAAGGDSNGDGGATTPANGFWNQIDLKAGSDASVINNTVIRYAGRFGQTALQITDNSATVTNTTLDENQARGMNLTAAATPTVSGCTFTNHGGAACDGVAPSALIGFSNNTSSGNQTNGIILRTGTLTAGAVINADSVMGGAHMVATNVVIPSGLSVTMGPGVVMKFGLAIGMNVEGTLTVNGNGSSQVVFTSATDDSIGGDSNGDGAATSPVSGYWTDLRFQQDSDASVLNNLRIRFGGRFGTHAVNLHGADITMSSCLIENCEAAGLDVGNGDPMGNSLPTVSGCAFNNNSLSIIEMNLEALPGFTNNTATGNSTRNVITQAGSTTLDSVTITVDNLIESTLYYPSNLTVAAGHVLTLDAGVVLKTFSSTITVDGTLLVQGSPGNEVVLTSLSDDAFGSDFALDGPTTGIDGEWVGLDFNAGSVGNILTGMRLRFGGRFGFHAVVVDDAPLTMTDCTIEGCQAAAMTLSEEARPVVSGCAFNDNANAVINCHWEALPGFTNNTATGNSASNATILRTAAIDDDTDVVADNVIAGALRYTTTTLNAGATLTLGPGVIVKAEFASGTVILDGTLIASGSDSEPVVFTSVRDDSVGGDTNLDGNTTQPLPNDWIRLSFSDTSDASVLENVVCRYGGRFGLPMVGLAMADITIIGCTLEECGATALNLSSNSFPTVVTTHFENNVRIIDGLRLNALGEFRRNTATGNATGDTFQAEAGNVDTTTNIYDYNYPNGALRVEGTISVVAGGSLILDAGVVIKVPLGASIQNTAGVIDVNGTGYRPVVFTADTDDEIGGDSNNDVSAGVPDYWTSFGAQAGAVATEVDHLLLRFAGRFGSVGLIGGSSPIRLRQVRVEHCGSAGIRLSGHVGNVWNCVSVNNGGDGIECIGGNFDLVHCTAADNGGIGFQTTAAHTGTVHNSIAWNNIGGDTDFVVAEVFNSDTGEVTFAGTNGNISADPLFVDSPNGDYNLGDGSPCINGGSFSRSVEVVLDHVERSRALDHDFSGQVLGDMGAFEKAGYELEVSGVEQLGTVMQFTVAGALAGTSTLGYGFLDGLEFCPGHGFLTIGLANTIVVINMMPANMTFFVPMPSLPALEGVRFGVQGAAFPTASPSTGNLTARYRGRLFN